MKAYLENTEVVLALSFVDSAGQPFNATSAQYRLLNGDGVELIAKTAIPGFTSGSTASLTIAANQNAVTVGAVRESRIVELYLANANGSIGQIESYVVEKLDPLVVPTTSFQSYAGAEVTAYSLPNMNGWAAATREQRIAALMEAKNRLCRLRYRMNRDEQDIVEPEFAASDMETIDATDWAAFPTEFKEALKKAQIIQADRLLSTDVHAEIQKHREDGLMSMTVGETSQMFRPGKPLLLSVCREALEYVGKYISWRRRIAR
jgi:hypothetical protein